MELIDGILYLLYFVLLVAVAVAIWSYVLRCRRSSGRGAVQNGVRMRILNSCVWVFLILVALIAGLCSDGSIVSIMLITLAVMLISSILSVVWAMIIRR